MNDELVFEATRLKKTLDSYLICFEWVSWGLIQLVPKEFGTAIESFFILFVVAIPTAKNLLRDLLEWALLLVEIVIVLFRKSQAWGTREISSGSFQFSRKLGSALWRTGRLHEGCQGSQSQI